MSHFLVDQRKITSPSSYIHFFNLEVQIETRHYYVRGRQTTSQPFSTEINNILNKCYMHSLTMQSICEQNYGFQIIPTWKILKIKWRNKSHNPANHSKNYITTKLCNMYIQENKKFKKTRNSNFMPFDYISTSYITELTVT
jgi:hypothetical protein